MENDDQIICDGYGGLIRPAKIGKNFSNMLAQCVMDAINNGMHKQSTLKDLDEFIDEWLKLRFKDV